VSGPWGSERGDRLILTIPVALLRGQGGGPRIAPTLPRSHLQALDRIGSGVVEKVLLRYRERWWPVPAGGYVWWFDAPRFTWSEWVDLSDGLGEPVLAILTVGMVLGFRITTGPVAALAGFVLIIAFGMALSWVAALIGLSVRNPETAQSAGFIWMFP
jgi:hypothetical protein